MLASFTGSWWEKIFHYKASHRHLQTRTVNSIVSSFFDKRFSWILGNRDCIV